ncbi:MAG: hypothetical protein U0796_01680 [Gemmatales bacterium]
MSNPPTLLIQLSQLQRDMREQMRFQVKNLRLELRDNEIVLQGRACSYYHKQLAQELVISRNYAENLTNEILVE